MDEQKEALKKLKELCGEHNMEPFDLNKSRDKALELVRRICGLPHRKVGRPSRADKENIGRYASALDDFWHDDKGRRVSQKQIQDAVVKEFDIQPQTNLYGEKSDPRQTVRRAYNDLKKSRKKSLDELSELDPDDHI